MSKHLERAVEAIENELLALSSMVEEMIDKACMSLINRKLEIAVDVIMSDEQIDEREVHIEEGCLKILALHQPVATDLRRVTTVLKINNDLERIADLAVNLAERAEKLILFPGIDVPPKMEEMADGARTMVRQALDAFVHQDVELARTVCAEDDRVDQLNAEVITEITQAIQMNAETVESAMHLLAASRDLERMADHATNIAEDVVYLVDGDIARHNHDGFLTPQERISRKPE